jgi:predicted secreted protein
MSAEARQVAVGTEFEVRLASPASAGYVWAVADVPAGVECSGRKVDPAPTASLPGDGTTQVFSCKAVAAGSHVIHFVLKRPWESTAADTHSVTVHAQEK